MTGNRYAEVLRSPGMAVWFAVLVCQRFPVAMAPLALVYLGHAVTGSYAVGALLGGAHALAEAAAAGPLGRRFDRRPARLEAPLVLGAEAVAFLLLAVLSRPPVPVLVALAVAGGAVSAGAHGGLRALLVRLAPIERRVAALSLESAASTTVWTVAPALVAVVAVLGARWPIALMAVLAASGAVAARGLRDPGRSSGPVAGERLWRRSWPTMAFDAAQMFAFGAVSLALPALLLSFQAGGGLAGPVLTAYTLAGIGGGLLYGARTWPGTALAQAVLLAAGTFLALGAAALAPALAPVVALFAVAGLFQTPALTARAAALQDRLDESQWAAGFSGAYAAAGLGYGAAGLVVAWLVGRLGAQPAMGLCVVIGAVVVLVSSAAEARAVRERAPRPAAAAPASARSS